jgi:polysaccharide biosynthesis protein PslG
VRLPLRLLAAALLALALTPAAAQAVPRTGFGIDIGRPLAQPPSRTAAELDRAKRLGMRIARLEVQWSVLEPERGRIDGNALGRLDAAVGAARRRGMKVFLLFLSTPRWATTAPVGAGDGSNYPPRNPRDAILAATTLASRYAGDLAAFEVWNEPDHQNELYWAGPNKVPQYVALAKALYGPLKQAAPQVPVLAGAFVGTNGAWLRALYREGIKGHYDALSFHFYDLTLRGLRDTRKVMREFGDGGVPVWLGEIGWSSCRGRTQLGHLCVTRGSQARQSADLVRALRRTSWVRGAVFFTLQDDGEFDFGAYDRAGRRKPLATALRREITRRRPAATRRVTLRLSTVRGRTRVSGTGPGADTFSLLVETPRYRYTGELRLGRDGRFRFDLPAVLGTRGLRVRVTHNWTGRRAIARR